MNVFCSDVNKIAFEIVEDFHKNDSEQLFLTLSLLLEKLATVYKLEPIEQLCSNLDDIPCLKYVKDVNSKIAIFLTCYISQHAIITLSDLENSMVEMLLSHNIYHIFHLKPVIRKARCEDPHEIELSDVQMDNNVHTERNMQNEGRIVRKFKDFGFGCIQNHPNVAQLFSKVVGSKAFQPSATSCQSLHYPEVSEDKCLQILLNILSDRSGFDSTIYTDYVDSLCASFGVSNLIDIGVHVQEDKFPSLVLHLSSAFRRFRQSEEKFVRNCNQNQVSSSKPKKKKVFVQSLKLKKPTQDLQYSPIFLAAERKFAGNESFPPSLRGIRLFLEEMLSPTIHSTKKKRKIENVVLDNESQGDPLVDIAAEYLFLHFGALQDISKRYILDDAATPTTADLDESAVKDVVEIRDILGSDEFPCSTQRDESSKKQFEAKDDMQNDDKDCEGYRSFECRRNMSRCLSLSMQEEASKYIYEISNEQLQTILSDLHVPPLPPPLSTTSTVSFASAQDLTPQESYVNYEIGRIGECIVFQYLRRQFETKLSPSTKAPMYNVCWLNAMEDSRAAYDLTVDPSSSVGGVRIFVEVKSSRYDDNNVFQLSLWEWDFLSQEPTVQYHIYRVFSVLDKQKTRIVILTNIRRLVELGRVQICLSI